MIKVKEMKSLSKFLKAFRKDAEYMPIAYPEWPKLPNPTKNFSQQEVDDFKIIFEKFEKEVIEIRAENDKRYETAFNRIGLCSFLNGASNPFALGGSINEKHFKWCPCEEWQNYLKPISWYSEELPEPNAEIYW